MLPWKSIGAAVFIFTILALVMWNITEMSMIQQIVVTFVVLIIAIKVIDSTWRDIADYDNQQLDQEFGEKS